MRRSFIQTAFDFMSFPLRAVAIFDNDFLWFTSLRSERFYYVKKEIEGYCLDIGCGPHNIFIKKFKKNNGIGIDVFKYEGLENDDIVEDMTNLPYKDNTFDCVTFIANYNHIPKSCTQ